MLFGLSGASRCGKTTVAKAVAEKLGIDFFATSTAKVVQQLGIDLKAPMTLRERLHLQLAILENHVEETMAIKKPTILDRTPLDMLAYLFCEFGMASHHDLDPDTIEKAQRYAVLCKDHVVQNFRGVFALKPLPDGAYEEGAFKPAGNPLYHAHYQLVLEGALCMVHNEVPYCVITTADHQSRVDLISQIVGQIIEHEAGLAQGATRH